jgi:hypothetical protein
MEIERGDKRRRGRREKKKDSKNGAEGKGITAGAVEEDRG